MATCCLFRASRKPPGSFSETPPEATRKLPGTSGKPLGNLRKPPGSPGSHREASRKAPGSLRDPSWKLPRSFWKPPGSRRELHGILTGTSPEAFGSLRAPGNLRGNFLEASGSFQKASGGFWKLPGSLRELRGSLLEAPRRLREVFGIYAMLYTTLFTILYTIAYSLQCVILYCILYTYSGWPSGSDC